MAPSHLSEQLVDHVIYRLETLCQLSIDLGRITNPVEVQEQLLVGAMELCHAEGGSLYLLKDNWLNFSIVRNTALGLSMGGSSGVAVTLPAVPINDAYGNPRLDSVVAASVVSQKVINLPDVYTASSYDFSTTRAFDHRMHYRSKSMLTVPLRSHTGEVIGVMQLINARRPPEAGSTATDPVPFSSLSQRIVESLAAQAALHISRQSLIGDMTNLFEGFVQLIADAIDAKSPYTGGHCRRVTEMTMLLAEAVSASDGSEIHETGNGAGNGSKSDESKSAKGKRSSQK